MKASQPEEFNNLNNINKVTKITVKTVQNLKKMGKKAIEKCYISLCFCVFNGQFRAMTI